MSNRLLKIAKVDWLNAKIDMSRPRHPDEEAYFEFARDMKNKGLPMVTLYVRLADGRRYSQTVRATLMDLLDMEKARWKPAENRLEKAIGKKPAYTNMLGRWAK